MNNRAIKKLLSVVLVMAICVSTVFGCLITVNAADTDATYTITAESLHAYADEGKATITLEDLASGFKNGSFTLLKNDNITHSTEYGEDEQGNKTVVPSPWDYEYKDVEIKVVGGVDENGSAVSADQMDIDLFYDTNDNGTNDIEEQVDGNDAWANSNSLWFDKPVKDGGTYKDAEGNLYAFAPGDDPDVADGTVFRHKDVKLADVSFSSDVVYKSITLELDFEFAYCMQPNSQNNIRIATSSQVDQDGVAYADPVLTNGEGTEAKTLSENVIDGNINYFHSHSSNNVVANGQLVHKNDYSIYTDKCKFCGVVSNQLISDELTSAQPNAYYDISALNVVYEDDGTVSLNLHCPNFQGEKEKLVISYADGKKTIYGDNKNGEIAGNSDFKKSPYAKEKIPNEETGTFTYSDNILPYGTRMYEIKGLSAKDIDTKFYLTRIVEGSGQYAGGLFCGHTQEVSLMDYCTDVVEGKEVYYPEGTTEAQITADKAVAVAFINYGVAAENALNHKVSYDKEEIVVTDTWDGKTQEPTETDYAGNIIINTAEELAWVALEGGVNTANKNYKVAANQVFDMNGMQGITLNSTIDDVKSATANSGFNWLGITNDTCFYGNFDGNGVIVYNVYSYASGNWGHSALFPLVKTNASTCEFKNISVLNSYFSGYHMVGGIVANGNATANDGSSLIFENCLVQNCYLNDNNNGINQSVGGTIVAHVAHNALAINNCLSANNEIKVYKFIGGFVGNSSDWCQGSKKISNSISIGTMPYPTATSGNELGKQMANVTYTNVYTDVESSKTGVTVLDTANMKGSAAATSMPALDWNGVWTTTDSYPAFNPDVYCTDVWDGTKVEPNATDADGNIIISTAEELAWVALQGGTATQGKNYKIADGIKYFNMNGSVGITADSTISQVKAATATTNLWNYSADFLGTFDGNGITIYNIRNATSAGYGGLFPRINGVDSSIKNVTVKASIIYASYGAGAIIGQANLQFTTTIDNCAVENCYTTDNNNIDTKAQRSAGVFVGSSGNHCIKINNCFAAGNECSAGNSYGGFVGRASAWAPGNFTFTNSICLGVSPYTTAAAGEIGKDISEKATWTNVYTDTDLPSGASASAVNGIKKLTTAQMQGDAAVENMPGLAWGAEWFEGKAGEYPSINGEVYADTWDGTFSEPNTTDDKGNIIINTAEEMAWVALRGGADTTGISYKVADGIDYFDMNGAVGITANSTAAEVQAATKTANIWRYEADGKVGGFCGNFDGNGVTIYNIYAAGYGYGALFPFVNNDVTINNVIVKASFLSGYHYASGIVGLGELQKTININKCVVENCYITDNGNTNPATTKAAAQFIAGTGNSNVNISNCFAADNILSAAGIEAGFVGTSGDHIQKGISITNSISIGMTPYSNVKIGSLGKGLTQQLTVANVYSDVACDVAGFTTIDADDAKGAGADEAMPNLGWGTDWFTGKPGEYPCFVDDGVEYVPDEIYELLATIKVPVGSEYYSYNDYIANFAKLYNRDNFTTSDENCDFYATGLTLKTNAYMTVTFAFLYDYRENKDDIEAVFTVGDQTITVKGNEMINNEGAGRYHMVRLKGINVANLCDDITVTLKYNGTQIGTGSISVAGFGFTANDAGEGYEYYESAAQALVFYAEALQNKIAVTTWPQ